MNAKYCFEKKAKISVSSDCYVGTAMNRNGDLVPALPQITITAEFDGEWESPEKLNADMKDCISKLQDAFCKHLLCSDQKTCEDRNNDRKQNGFKNFFK